MTHRRFLALIVMTGVSGLYGLEARADEPPAYEVYAVRYATCSTFRSLPWSRGPSRSGSSTSR